MILLAELMSGKSGNREGLIYPLQRDQSLPVIKGPLALIGAELNDNYWLTKSCNASTQRVLGSQSS